MPARRELLYAHRYARQRAIAALVLRDADPDLVPLRLGGVPALAGVLIAGLAVAVAAAIGALSPSAGTRWREAGAVIVERESGARFVYLDGALHPVLNYASARLIVGAQAHVVTVDRASLDGVARGVTLGIPGAPDSLPEPRALIAAPWQLCSSDVDGTNAALSSLIIGGTQDGGYRLGDAGVLVSAGRDSYLLWHGRRFRLADPIVRGALGWSAEPPTVVAPHLLDVLPAGQDLDRLDVAGLGQPSAGVPGAKVGAVFVVQTQAGGRQFAVVRADGLATISQVQADLLLGDPRVRQAVGQVDAQPLGTADFNALPHATDLTPRGPDAPPASTPLLRHPSDGAAALCAWISSAVAPPEIVIDAAVPASTSVVAGVRPGSGVVDRVFVEPGRGVLTEAVPFGAARGALWLITDLGMGFPLTGDNVGSVLGYAGVVPIRLPATVVALVPAGRALDPVAARTPVTG